VNFFITPKLFNHNAIFIGKLHTKLYLPSTYVMTCSVWDLHRMIVIIYQVSSSWRLYQTCNILSTLKDQLHKETLPHVRERRIWRCCNTFSKLGLLSIEM